MDRKLLALVVVVGIAGTGAVFFAGFGSIPGGGNAGDVGTATPASGGSSGSAGTSDGGGDGQPATTETTPPPPFVLTVDNIEKCGQTCRDVTTTLTNQQSTDATDVVVSTQIYAGKGTDGKRIWEGSEEVGDLGAGESYTATKRVKLSMGDAFAVKQNGGWITIRTSVDSTGESLTFTQQRDVA